MIRTWMFRSFATSLLGFVACGGEFSSSNAAGQGAEGGGSGSGGSAQTTGAGGSAGSIGGTGGGIIGSAGTQGIGGSGPGGAGLGGGSMVDGGTAIIDGAISIRGATLDAQADVPAPGCVPGTLQCDAVPSRRCQDDRQWHNYHCGPLLLSDISAIDITKFLGFHLGFRCKTITVCGIAQNCNYSGEMMGTLESGEAMFYDGVAFMSPTAVKISLNVGAASQCGNPVVTIQAGESFSVTTAQQVKRIFLPAFMGTDFVFYVREDGATFKDQALTLLLQGPG